MAEPNTISSSMNGQPRGNGKRAGWSTELTPPEPRSGLGLGTGSSLATGVPCGACKFLRRKCVNGCIFAPHFSPEQGTALFAAVDKVFGASNVSKLLMQLPVDLRDHAVKTILYEAQARLSDPVCGCVSVIISLQKQVAELQEELAMVKNKVINTSLMAANTFQANQLNSLEVQACHHLDLQPCHHPDLQPCHHLDLQQCHHLDLQPCHYVELQPVYQIGSSASNNNMTSMNMFDPSLLNLANDHQNAVDREPMLNPLQFTGPFYNIEDDEEETVDPLVFADQMF